MAFSFKPLSQQIIVITGATSGIGLATARAAAAAGAKLVLVARNEDVLKQTVDEMTAGGREATYVVADVGERAAAQRIADAARARFGGFDTWVNNAGHSIYGRLEEVAEGEHERLFQTNFWGVVYGSLAALVELKQRGGALINVGSIASDNAIPMQGMYSASKHAVKGFTDALRMELQQEGAPVSVTLIKPTSIDTPFPQHARNYMEEEPKVPAPVYAPEEVARAILHAATQAKREIYVGSSAKTMSVMGKVVPGVVGAVSSRVMPRAQQRGEPPRDPTGTLFQAGVDGRVRGDHPGRAQRSYYTRAAMHPGWSGAIVAAAGLAAVWFVRSRMAARRNASGAKAGRRADVADLERGAVEAPLPINGARGEALNGM